MCCPVHDKNKRLYYKMFKRPTIRRSHVAQVFSTEVRANGAIASQWVAAPISVQRVPTGHPSRVGDIVDKLRAPPIHRSQQKAWTPPMEYEFVASRMDAELREGYLKRCEEWFEAHPPRPPKARAEAAVLNTEPIIKLFARYRPSPPPLPELMGVWRSAGYSEAKIAKAKAWFDYCETHSSERQKELDAIFCKYPTANKPTPKVKAPSKPIKAVKKKMT